MVGNRPEAPANSVVDLYIYDKNARFFSNNYTRL